MNPAAVRIFNTWDQLKAYGGDRIAIYYQPQGDSRSVRVPGWYVSRLLNGKEVATDPKAAWYDYGRKFFMCPIGMGAREGKPIALKQAIAWAAKTYRLQEFEFVRNRQGSYVERQVNEKYPIPKGEAP